jgi:hypothetical protein
MERGLGNARCDRRHDVGHETDKTPFSGQGRTSGLVRERKRKRSSSRSICVRRRWVLKCPANNNKGGDFRGVLFSVSCSRTLVPILILIL